MDLGLLSPHQFSELEPYLDTIVVSTYDTSSLDVAVPYQATLLISQTVAERLQSRFHGRMTFWPGGDTRHAAPASEAFLAAITELRPHPIHYVLVLTDRTMVRPVCHLRSSTGASCVVVDWWQWFRAHVPEHRLIDAWMFLCCACTTYRRSDACRRIGWPPDVLQAMAAEGERLFEAFLDSVADTVVQMWSQSETR